MNASAASVMVCLALVLAAAAGYVAGVTLAPPQTRTLTETATTTFTTTLGNSTEALCVSVLYRSWYAAYVSSSATYYTTSVIGYNTNSFTTTAQLEPIGYSSTTTQYATGKTLTGAINEWNTTVCTFR